MSEDAHEDSDGPDPIADGLEDAVPLDIVVLQNVDSDILPDKKQDIKPYVFEQYTFELARYNN